MAVAGITLERTSAGVPTFATIDLRKHADFIPLLEERGVEVSTFRNGYSKTSPRKTGLEEAFEDIENGRITRIYTPKNWKGGKV